MNIKEILLESLKSERRLTRDTIVAMTDGDVQFRPTEVQMNFGSQALHLLSAWETLRDALQGKGWEWEKGLTQEQYPTQELVLSKFDEVTAADLEYYGNLEPEQLLVKVTTGWGTQEPVLALFYSFLTHEAHHRGQMVTYLRLKGMKPATY